MSTNSREPLAIVGIGCRFPGGVHDVPSFWNLLREGVNAVSEVPRDRWNVDRFYDPNPQLPGKMITRWGGFLDKIDLFDARFFGISPREALRMDPQQRWLLEVAWEALEDGGQPPDRMEGSRTGVFVGIASNDYANIQGPWAVDVHTNSGSTLSIASNRISYLYNLKGPSISIDTACSSALVAVNLACNSIWSGQCESALAGGVNALITPYSSIGFSKASMLSPKGRCFAFDKRADGYVRGEGVGMIVIKPLSVAIAEEDSIYAVIRASVVNQDGRTSSMTVPGRDSQEEMLIEAYEQAGISPRQVCYMEAHGTGTPVGDPIETLALGTVLSQQRPVGEECVIGSVKTNIGHLESASGIAGLIKAVLILHNKEIPPNLNFKDPNPEIPFEKLNLRVPTKVEPLPNGTGPAITAVNSFGFGGTNAHVVFAEAPKPARRRKGRKKQNVRPSVLPISAKDPEALKSYAEAYRDILVESADNADSSLSDIIYSASLRKNHHENRLALIGKDRDALVEQIDAFLAGTTGSGWVNEKVKAEAGKGIAFVFTGQGPQWWAMGRKLLKKEPVFRKKIEESDRILSKFASWSLLEELNRDESSTRLGETEIAQPCIFALQVGLAALWRSWGVTPSAVVGHSVGEVTAIYIAGIYSLEDAMRIIYNRSRLQQTTHGKGAMYAVGMTLEEARKVVESYEGRVEISAINSPSLVTLSGESEAIEEAVKPLEEKDYFCRSLKVNYAFHSFQMDPIREELIESLEGIKTRSADIKVFSTVTGKQEKAKTFQSQYWWDNVRKPVQFASAVEAMIGEGYDTFLELGPHPSLSSSISECIANAGGKGTVLPSLRRNEDDQEIILGTLAKLFCLGHTIDWKSLCDKDARFVRLPSYPWQHERFWLESPSSHEYRLGTIEHPFLGMKATAPSPTWECVLDPRAFAYLTDHRLRDSIVFPASAYVEMGLAAGKAIYPNDPIAVEDMKFVKALFFGAESSVTLQFIYDDTDGSFKIFSSDTGTNHEWDLHAHGRIQKLTPRRPEQVDLEKMRSVLPERVDHEKIYSEFKDAGYQFGPCFSEIQAMWRRPKESLGEIPVPKDVLDTVSEYQFHPAIMDACFQCVKGAQVVADDANAAENFYLPVAVDRVRLFEKPGAHLWSHARLIRDDGEIVEADIDVFDESGNQVAEIRGFRAQRVKQSDGEYQSDLNNCFYQFEWRHDRLLGGSEMCRGIKELEDPSQISETLKPQIRPLYEQIEMQHYLEEFVPQVDHLSFHYILNAFSKLGWAAQKGDRITVAGLRDQFGIVEQHHRLFDAIMEHLRTENVFKVSDEGEWEVSEVPELQAASSICEKLKSKFPNFYVDIDLLESCGPVLAEVLTGKEDPLELIFPGGSASRLEKFYTDAPDFILYNQIIQKVVSLALGQLKEKSTIRILEIGAGTGSMTAKVLEVLPKDKTHYTFTDITPLFTGQAKQKFKDYDFIEYSILDIEKSPLEQNFHPHSFDLILATNVLHATSNLRDTLQNISKLMSSEGLLIFLEATTGRPFLDLVFGLLEGWWNFKDTDLRPSYALLSPRKWENLLSECGFSDVTSIVDTEKADDAFQTLFMTRGPKLETLQEPEIDLGEDTAPDGAWLIFTDDSGTGAELAGKLEKQGNVCLQISSGDNLCSQEDGKIQINPGRREDIAEVLARIDQESTPIKGVVHLWSLNHPRADKIDADSLLQSQQSGCLHVLKLAQALVGAELKSSPRVWLITRGANSVEEGEILTGIASTPLLGMTRVANNEHEDFRWTVIDLASDGSEDEAQALFEEISSNNEELEVSLRQEGRFVNRLVRKSIEELPVKTRDAIKGNEILSYQLEIPTPGILDNLVLIETERLQPGPEEVQIQVAAAGLNFRDVMKAMGIYPGYSEDLKWFGDECSGTVVSVGDNVTDYKVGDEVIAMVPYCFRSFATIDHNLVIPKPSRLSFEEAATLPIVYLTTHYALNHLARLEPGEKVLIHAAAGGVGQAAIQIAQGIGAEIFATAGSPEKRDFLRSLGISHVMDSRSLDFADEIKEITGGKGVDVVLNSLAGDFIPKSFSVLAPFGRFLEIGKIDIYQNSKIGLETFKNNISFFAIDLSKLLEERPEFLTSMLRKLAVSFEDGSLRPLPLKTFPITRAADAFRYMAQAKHTGKIVLSMQQDSIDVGSSSDQRSLFNHDATYLITGGLGGFGIELTRWMVDKGARNIVLMGRSGAASEEVNETLESLRRQEARIEVVKADVTVEQDVIRVLSDIKKDMPPLKGVIHAAMVLDDAFLAQLEDEQFTKVLGPKMIGAWLLHKHTRDLPLDHFINFSSASSMVGATGQGNYASANFFLDAMAYYRRSLGLPALTLNWGALSEVGYVARHEKVAKYLDQLGLERFTPAEALGILGRVLNRTTIQLGASRVNWKALAKLNPATTKSPTYAKVANLDSAAGALGADASAFRLNILSASPKQRHEMLVNYICGQVAQVFGTTADKIDGNIPLTAIGLDSLMAIELMNRLESNLGISLPMGKFLQGPTISQLSESVLELLVASAGDEDASGTQDGAPSVELETLEPGEELTEFPLSKGQRALWFLHRLAPDSPAYNLIYSSRISPYVDIPVMQEAFADLFRRHPMLDVTFSLKDGEPVQSIRTGGTIEFREHDATMLDDDKLKVLLVEHANRPFDLRHGPVIRLELFRTADNAHVVILSMHHIVSDAWSVVLLMNDLIESYFSLRAGGRPKYEPLEFRYHDYVRWQERLLESAEGGRMLRYWEEQMAGAPPTLDLPTDRPRAPVQTFNGATCGFKLEETLTKKILAFSAERNVTLYTTLLSAFQVLLHRYCNQDDIVVGSPFAGRRRKEFHELIGYFINPVALRSRIDDDPSFTDYLERVGQTVIGALENQEYPLAKLVDRLKVRRDPSRSPIFQVSFSMERIPGVDEQGIAVFLIGQGGHKFQVGDITVESIDLNLRMAQFEITLVVEEAGGNIYGCWQYNSDLFDSASIARLNDLYKQVLLEAVDHPERRISEFTLLSPHEEKTLLGDWNDTAVEFPRDLCLHQLIAQQVERAPDAVAVTSAGKSLTYAELDRRANGVANLLQSEGIGPDAPVGLLADRSVDMLVAVLGIMKSGGCYVPLDPAFPAYRIEQMLEDSCPTVVLTQGHLVDRLPKGDWKIHLLEDAPTADEAPETSGLSPESLAYIIYTSGSTGRPKGVEIPHSAVVNFLCSMRDKPGLGQDDKLLAVTTLSFDISVLELFLPLLTGAHVVVATRDEAADGRRLAALLEEFEITAMQATPATWQMLLDCGWPGRPELRVFCGGESLPLELAGELLARTAEVWNLYGPTETTVWSSVQKLSPDHDTVTIGRPIANTTLYVMDDRGGLVPPGFVGNLYIGGAGLARGYHKSPEQTREKFTEVTLPNGKTERLYATGDLARYLPDGRLICLGRGDNQVKLHGYRIEPGEIEAQIASHPDVKQAVVLKRSDLPGGLGLAAYITVEEKREGLVAQLRSYLGERLPEYMRPAVWTILEEFPLTPNNKIDRGQLPAPALDRSELGSAYQDPQTPSEIILADIIGMAFKDEKIGILDNFFELGGDSLLAVQIISEISEAFNRELPVAAFLQNPTVESLARYLDETPPQEDKSGENGPIPDNGRIDWDDSQSSYLTLVPSGSNGANVEPPQVDAVALAYIPDFFIPLSGLSKDEIVREWLGGAPYLSNIYETASGRIGVIMLPRLGAELYKNQESLRESVLQSLEMASRMGAKTVSLTGLIPSATDNGRRVGEWIDGLEDVPVITTGHAATTAAVVNTIAGLLKLADRNMADEKVAVIGLGSIGRATLSLMLEMLPNPRELILCDIFQKSEALKEIHAELNDGVGYKGKVQLEPTHGQLPKSVYDATFILGATNVPGILDVNQLGSGTLIVDDSFPPCFRLLDAIRRIEERHDILFTTGGLLRLPEEIRETIYLPNGSSAILEKFGERALRTMAGRDPREITGCILSSLLTGQRREIRPTLGPIELKDSVAHYKLINSLGMEAANPQSENYFIPPEAIARFKDATDQKSARAK